MENFEIAETIDYPNGGRTRMYVCGDVALAVDEGICAPGADGRAFDYALITSTQNAWVARYRRLFRFLGQDLREDAGIVDRYLSLDVGEKSTATIDVELQATRLPADRANIADASPLERAFEEHFSAVYGADAVRFLEREYAVTDLAGHTRFVDYLVRTRDGQLIGVEENGVTYHHPQLIGIDAYRTQLEKQNACQLAGIKLYRFSTEDCRFAERLEDDIRSYFGPTSDAFVDTGLVVRRPFELYNHQEDVLSQMAAQRASGTRSFLAVLPTGTGKSQIVIEDLARFAREFDQGDVYLGSSQGDVYLGSTDEANPAMARVPVAAPTTRPFSALITAPTTAIVADWRHRLEAALPALAPRITVCTYGWLARHYLEYDPHHFAYVVIDEAHHAVAPALRRVCQYFDPAFLVGLTATDQRPDRRSLESVFGSYRVSLSLEDAMRQGIVAQARAFRIETNVDLSQVRVNGREYVNADLEKTLRVSSRNELIVDVLLHYFARGEAARRQGVVFCVNVRHAKEMARLLNDAGIPAHELSSQTHNPGRVMDEFRSGKIRFLCSCQMISEGWDYPELGILVMARPTLSRVLYLQQLGRGLRRTPSKRDVFVIDVVDEYGSMVMPCSLHSIFQNPSYVPFGSILRRNYVPGEWVEVDGIRERIERIVPVEVTSFAERYEGYFSVEQVARDFFVNTGTVNSWMRRGRLSPTVSFEFGSRKVHLFSPEDVAAARERLGIPVHDDSTIRDDFFAFLEQRDYSLSYKMPFMLAFLDHLDTRTGSAAIADVLADYTAFYQRRIDEGLVVDRASCPYTAEFLADSRKVRGSMLTNPFEKFERKRFMYYSRDLGQISLNHALLARLTKADFERIRQQMREDLKDYYAKL